MSKFRSAYRPERHYMRGPGPKWHAKHTATLVLAASKQLALTPNANRAAKARYPMPVAVWIVPVTAAMVLGFVAVVALA